MNMWNPGPVWRLSSCSKADAAAFDIRNDEWYTMNLQVCPGGSSSCHGYHYPGHCHCVHGWSYPIFCRRKDGHLEGCLSGWGGGSGRDCDVEDGEVGVRKEIICRGQMAMSWQSLVSSGRRERIKKGGREGRACGSPIRRWGRMLDTTVRETDFWQPPFLWFFVASLTPTWLLEPVWNRQIEPSWISQIQPNWNRHS